MPKEYLNNKHFENIIARFQKTKKEKAIYETIINNIELELEVEETVSFEEAIEELRRIEEEYHDLQNQLAAAFFTLSDNLAHYKRFQHVDIDDAIQEGVMICFEKVDRFNPDFGKAFSYMTTCVLNHFRQLYRTARNYNELKKKYHDYLESQVNQAVAKSIKSREKSRVASMKYADLS